MQITNVHRFFQSLSLPLFIIHLKILGTQLINLILLNQNINSHVIPAYSFYFYAVFLGFFFFFFNHITWHYRILAPWQGLGLPQGTSRKMPSWLLFSFVHSFFSTTIFKQLFSNFHKIRYVLWLFHLLRIFSLSGFPDG